MVAKVVKASFPGHVVNMPPEWRAPFIFASPHSGRDYPTRFLADAVLDVGELRRSEDAYVDQLMPLAEDIGVPTLLARFPRAFVDVNRNHREIDPFMFTTSPIQGSEIRSNRVLAGFGAIPKYAAEGRPIYARKLSGAEGRSRIKRCYAPYHDALRTLINECRERFGSAILIDWHSMPSASVGGTRPLPDIVLGDRYGASCDRSVTAAWEDALQSQGLTVSRNTPYAGGYVTSLYGLPGEGTHVLQIEINRRLYLDESRVSRLPHCFDRLRHKLFLAADRLVEEAQPPVRYAAE